MRITNMFSARKRELGTSFLYSPLARASTGSLLAEVTEVAYVVLF